jgi:hypothetical protein
VFADHGTKVIGGTEALVHEELFIHSTDFQGGVTPVKISIFIFVNNGLDLEINLIFLLLINY